MKKFKKSFIVTILLVLVLLLSGCKALLGAFENEKLRNHTDVMLNAILMNDADAGYSLVEDVCERSDFDPAFIKMCEMLNGVNEYNLNMLSIYQKAGIDNGESYKYVDSVYEMTANNKRYIISVQLDGNTEKLRLFNITPYEKTNYYYTGVITNMKDASVIQWGFLLSNLLVVALVVFALIDCCRHKIKLKPLWIVIILLGAFSIGATISSTSFHVNFSVIWFTAYSAFVRYGGGQVLLRFVIPWGAPLYFILRHWLIKKPEPAPITETDNFENIQTEE